MALLEIKNKKGTEFRKYEDKLWCGHAESQKWACEIGAAFKRS